MTEMIGCGGAAFLGFLPLLLSLVAIIDIVRTGAEWYWIMIVLFFPVVGSLAYFILVRSPLAGGGAATLSPASARRIQAQRRLRELAIQLAHWRGPAILNEAGEELLVLGKYAQAESHLREAREAGSPPDEVNFPLAQALEMQGRFTEAVPLLAELCRSQVDFKFGQAQLHYARALDESGQGEAAERELRDLLERRSFFEAQVRLARLLLRRGAAEESARLLAEARAAAVLLPPYLRREHLPWIRAARRLRAATDRLPEPRVEGGVPPGRRLRLLLLGGLALALLLAAAWLWLGSSGPS